MLKKIVKIALAVLAAAGTLALAACWNSPKVFNYGNGTPNITVEQG